MSVRAMLRDSVFKYLSMSSNGSGTGISIGFSIEFECDNDGGKYNALAHCAVRELNNPKSMTDAIIFLNRDANHAYHGRCPMVFFVIFNFVFLFFYFSRIDSQYPFTANDAFE